MPVQKQTRAGQRTRFKAFVAIGDYNGHVGLGVKCSKEVATAIRGAIILAKLSIVPVRRGFWGNKIGKPHTVPSKVSREIKTSVVIFWPLYPNYEFLVGQIPISDLYHICRDVDPGPVVYFWPAGSVTSFIGSGSYL